MWLISLRYVPNFPIAMQKLNFNKLPDSVLEFIRSHVSAGLGEALKTHCRRELFHEALCFLFDAEFVEAWTNGLVVDCIDGIKRRVYPRIFTWSADYPEK